MSDHGSNKRQRRVTLAGRFNEAEAATVRAMAEKRGLSVSSLFRTTMLGLPAPARSVRKPLAETQAVARMLAEIARLTGAVNKVGSNINQIAKETNMGRDPRLNSLLTEWQEFKEMFDRDQNEIRGGCMRALGLEPNRKIDD